MARILDRGLEWTLTSGLRVVLIVGGVLVSLWLYRTLTRRLQALLEGVAPTAEQAKMNRRIKKTFDARGIEIPFPHQTLYWGVAKDGTAPPLPLAAPGDGAAIPHGIPERRAG
jgi:hypothetical protein